MKIKTSKIMAKKLNAESPYTVLQQTMTRREYRLYVGSYFVHPADYDPKTDKFSVLVIVYPDDYYAMNQYITTAQLTDIYTASNGTWESFVEQFNIYVAI